ncbi:MAG: hypothetical protein U1F42_00835 [Candidatus Competibacteraceae bacterium]
MCVRLGGGDRDPVSDRWMGAVAERLANRVIVTDDNPRTEDPARIVGDIHAAFGNGAGHS